MKKNFLTVTSACLISIFTITSCSKKDDVPSYSKSQIVGTYMLTGLTSGSTNIYAGMDDCEKDNLQIFNEDNTYDLLDSGETCEDAEDETGTWSVSKNKLTLDDKTFTIEKLTENELIISGNINTEVGIRPARATYIKD